MEPPFPKIPKFFWLKKVGFAEKPASCPVSSPTIGIRGTMGRESVTGTERMSCHRGKGRSGKLGFLSFFGRRSQAKSWERPNESWDVPRPILGRDPKSHEHPTRVPAAAEAKLMGNKSLHRPEASAPWEPVQALWVERERLSLGRGQSLLLSSALMPNHIVNLLWV